MLNQGRAYLPIQGRRQQTRQEVSLSGKFQCQGDYKWITCEVTNISPFGAEVRLTKPMVVPRSIRLQILSDSFDATADVRHQNGRTIGVEFTSSRLEALARYS